MRSTFVFLAMLIFVSCNQNIISTVSSDESADAALVELTKAPESEAVFATIAVQMQAGAGFQRILGILNDLVNDAKKQLHFNTKMYRKSAAECRVSRFDYKQKQAYFDNLTARAQRGLINARNRLGVIEDNIKGFNKAKEVYSDILKSAIKRHHGESEWFKGMQKACTGALNALNAAKKALQDWTPKDQALIQTHINEASKSFLEIKGFALPDVSALVETARTNDKKVRHRLLQWLSGVQAAVMIAKNRYENVGKVNAKEGAAFEKALGDITARVIAGIKGLNISRSHASYAITASGKAVKLFGDLARRNEGLRKAKREYCSTNNKNFLKAKAANVSAIKLFSDLRRFFVNRYNALHSYIKTKYFH